MNDSTQTIALTGATGFVGRHITRALLDAGYSVRGLVRDLGKVKEVLPDPRSVDSGTLSFVEGDVFDAQAMHDLAEGAHTVINTIGIRLEKPGVTFDRMHTDATRVTLSAAESAGAQRFIQVSAMGTRANAPTAYWRTKWDSEMLVRQSALGWTILRPSLIHGHDAELMQMIKGWALGRSLPYFFMPYFSRPQGDLVSFPPQPPRFESARFAPVHVEDVAGAVLASIERDEAIGETYQLCGSEETDWPEMLRHMTEVLPMANPKKPILGLPGVVGEGMAIVAGAIGLGASVPFSPSEARQSMEDMTSSTEKAKAHLGFDPMPFFEPSRAYAGDIV